ncbi:MAG: type II secretion system protein, partial [Myxococcota bacterium]|nr:type II secretion system protein [Myxococcota bacterium]
MQGREGFSLVEMAIVLAVTSVLATVFVPGFIASTQQKLAERVAKDIEFLQDAASSYFTQDLDADGENHWPGFSAECEAQKDASGQYFNPLRELIDKGYLAHMDALQDPWGGQYEMRVLENTAGCSLQIKTAAGTVPVSALHRLKKLSANSHMDSVFVQGEEKHFLTTTIPTPLVTSMARGALAFSTGVVRTGDDTYIGEGRKCFTYTHYLYSRCRHERMSCHYNKETGHVEGAVGRSGSCTQVQCSWVCFDDAPESVQA